MMCFIVRTSRTVKNTRGHFKNCELVHVMPSFEFPAASILGAVGLAVGHPLDTIKVLVCAPIDLVKVCLQGQTCADRYCGPVYCMDVILREEGLRGLYRGDMAIALRDVPCYGLYFLPYKAVLMAGGMAGVVTWAFATPRDVVKARL